MDITENIYLLFSIIPLIAFMYASVGHGGASGYLALMTLIGMSQAEMKPTALLLNIAVAGISFLFFAQAGHLRFKLFLAFAIGSVPASFLGGLIETDPFIYKLTLGIFLLFATLKLSGLINFLFQNKTNAQKKFNFVYAVLIGVIIGFLSGLIGIGGGIILSPVLLIIGWANVKEAAAISALFIFVNSISGFTGQVISGVTLSSNIYILVAIAVVGGLAGSFFGTHKFNHAVLKKVLAAVLLFASFKLILI